MTEKLFLFGCEESYFFRDGTPFAAGEDTFLRSGFPPSCNVMQGAVRTAIMRGHGVDFTEYQEGHCSVCDCIGEECEVLEAVGSCVSGQEDMKIDLTGAFVTLKTHSEVKRLYRVPRDLMLAESDASEIELCRARPSSEPIATDMGLVFMPQCERNVRGLSNAWISETGLLSYLTGVDASPSELYFSALPDASWDSARVFMCREQRMGIAREKASRATVEGMLYAIEHVRLADVQKEQFGIGVRVRGCPDISIPDVVRLGGEGRFTSLEVLESMPIATTGIAEAIDEGPGLFGEHGFKLVFLSPVRFSTNKDGYEWLPSGFIPRKRDGATVWEGVLSGIQCTLVSVCSDRPIRIGGWDMALKRPKPRLAYVPDCVVYYFTTPHNGAEVVGGLHDTKIGMNSRIGFGHTVVGRW